MGPNTVVAIAKKQTTYKRKTHGQGLFICGSCDSHMFKVRVALLQNEVGTNDFFRATNFLTKNAPKFSPKLLSLYFVGQKKNPAKFPSNFPPNFPPKKLKENH